MKKFLNAFYHLSLIGIMVLGILYLGEMLPGTEEAEEERSENTQAVEENTENNIIDEQALIADENSMTMDKEMKEYSTKQDEMEAIESADEESFETEESPLYLADKDALELLSNAVVTNTEGYSENFNSNGELNVFAEDIINSFSFKTLVWYNLWGDNSQNVVFNAQKIAESGQIFAFEVGIASGGSGTVKLQVFFDGEAEHPEYEYILDAEQAPIRCEFDITDRESMKILVDNCSSSENTIVFYDLLIGSGTEV